MCAPPLAPKTPLHSPAPHPATAPRSPVTHPASPPHSPTSHDSTLSYVQPALRAIHHTHTECSLSTITLGPSQSAPTRARPSP
jgi:hypothetical protein